MAVVIVSGVCRKAVAELVAYDDTPGEFRPQLVGHIDDWNNNQADMGNKRIGGNNITAVPGESKCVLFFKLC